MEKLKNKPKNGVNSYFKIYSTDPAVLNDSNFSNKSNENIGNHLTSAQSNENFIEALKSKLLDEIMPYIKIFINEELNKYRNYKILRKRVRISKTRICQ